MPISRKKWETLSEGCKQPFPTSIMTDEMTSVAALICLFLERNPGKAYTNTELIRELTVLREDMSFIIFTSALYCLIHFEKVVVKDYGRIEYYALKARTPKKLNWWQKLWTKE